VGLVGFLFVVFFLCPAPPPPPPPPHPQPAPPHPPPTTPTPPPTTAATSQHFKCFFFLWAPPTRPHTPPKKKIRRMWAWGLTWKGPRLGRTTSAAPKLTIHSSTQRASATRNWRTLDSGFPGPTAAQTQPSPREKRHEKKFGKSSNEGGWAAIAAPLGSPQPQKKTQNKTKQNNAKQMWWGVGAPPRPPHPRGVPATNSGFYPGTR